jgi:ribonuclease HI/GNAT superfamily N-acetyltransferase
VVDTPGSVLEACTAHYERTFNEHARPEDVESGALALLQTLYPEDSPTARRNRWADGVGLGAPFAGAYLLRSVALVGGVVVGFVKVLVTRGELFVDEIAVHKQYQRKGLGAFLLLDILQAVSRPRVRLQYRIDNTDAERAYTCWGLSLWTPPSSGPYRDAGVEDAAVHAMMAGPRKTVLEGLERRCSEKQGERALVEVYRTADRQQGRSGHLGKFVPHYVGEVLSNTTPERDSVVEEVLDQVRAHAAGRKVAWENLDPEKMFSEKNITEAIRKLRRGTVPGNDGFSIEFYARPDVQEYMVPHLRRLFLKMAQDGVMTEAMREAIISVLYKGRGKEKTRMKSYRPISVTMAEYRIMTKAIQLKLQGVVRSVIGETQMAYVGGERYCHDNVILLAELTRRMHQPGNGGVAVQVDNSAAFDRVRHDFLKDVLKAYGFPEPFMGVVDMLYESLTFRVRVKGVDGCSTGIQNSVRQGCGVAPLLFILVQEALLIALRACPALEGITVDKRGESRTTLERCVADDTVVYLRRVEHLKPMFEVMRKFQLASGQSMNADKSSAVLVGDQCGRQGRAGVALENWFEYGRDELDPGLGVTVGTEEQVARYTTRLHERVRQECAEELRVKQGELSLTARHRLINGKYAARLPYELKSNVARNADAENAQTQATFDQALWKRLEGKRREQPFSTRQAVQPEAEGGVGHIHVQSRIEAEWADNALALVRRPDDWKAAWLEVLERSYGPLATPDLLHSTCAFHAVAGNPEMLELQRRSLQALAKLPPPQGRTVPLPGEGDGEMRTQASLRREAECAEWTADECMAQRMFLSPWFNFFPNETVSETGVTSRKGDVLHPHPGRASPRHEGEAVVWAREGLLTLGDMRSSANPGRLMSVQEFRLRFRGKPHVLAETWEAILRSLPSAWKLAIARGTRASGERPRREIVVGVARTLREREAKDVRKLRVSDIYERYIARMWEMPVAFRPAGQATKVWLRHQQGAMGGDDEHRATALEVLSHVRHPALPSWVGDRLLKVAHGNDRSTLVYYGSKVCSKDLPREDQEACKACGCRHTNTAHMYGECPWVVTLWGRVLKIWERLSGGETLDPADLWVTQWGMRRHTWDQGSLAYQGAAMQERWKVLHAATIVEIAARWRTGRPGVEPNPNDLINRVMKRVRYILSERMLMNEAAFRKVWVDYAAVSLRGCSETLCLDFWCKGWTPPQGESAVSAPLEVYTDGSAKGKRAGYGFVLVARAAESATEEAYGQGPVVTNPSHADWRGATRATNNTGEVSAVLAALEWMVHPERCGALHGKAVTIRYDSTYAANMVQGRWRPKRGRNVCLIRAAQEALRRASAEITLTWRHVKAHSDDVWNDRVDELAKEGADMTTPEVQQSTRSADSGVPPTVTCPEERRVRWVQWAPTEVNRVHRALTPFGVLNVKASGRISRAMLHMAAARCKRRVGAESRAGRVDLADARSATHRVEEALSTLSNPQSCKEAAVRQAKGWNVRTIRCRINAQALRAFVARHGDTVMGGQVRADGGVGRSTTYRAAADSLLAECSVDGAQTCLMISYRYSSLGRALLEAGHISASREYAVGEDPFKWPSDLRDAAFADMGYDFDLIGAYQNARLAMIPVGAQAVRKLLSRREAVLAAIGNYLWPELTSRVERRKRAKGVINAYDMGASIDFWQHNKSWGGNPRGRSLRDKYLTLGDESGTQYAGTTYCVGEYHAAQVASGKWVEANAQAMIEFIKAHRSAEQNKKKRADLCAASYLLQEAEATSREAQIRCCVAQGLEVINLQHDGIVVYGVAPEAVSAVSSRLAAAASTACGFPLTVEAKRIGGTWVSTADAGGGGEDAEEHLGLPPLRATRA